MGAEALFLGRLREALEGRGAWTKKVHGERSQEVGVDLYAVHAGIPFAMELKAFRGLDPASLLREATDLQIHDLLHFAQAGGRALVVGEDPSTRQVMSLDLNRFPPKISTTYGVRQAGPSQVLWEGASVHQYLDHILGGKP